MAAVATHPGGAFYVWYRSVYGYNPPATVDSNASRYLAWQQGMSKSLAELIPYGSFGPPGIAIAGGAITQAPQTIATPPPAPPPAPPPLPVPGLGSAGGAILGAPGGVKGAGPGAGVLQLPPGIPPVVEGPIIEATNDTTEWWRVTASLESLGGQGACRAIQPRGYSELSTVPRGNASDFSALGHIPCGTVLYIRNPATGQTAGAVKQDVGAGSAFLPVMGLYPQTVADIGLPKGAGEFTVEIRRQDGVPLHPVRGTQVAIGGSGLPVSTPVSTSAHWANPLGHARVTAERIDQGVDYAGSGYLVAITDAVVVDVVLNGSGWEGEGWVMYRITHGGQLDGAYVYYAEGVDPVVRKGQVLRPGDKVANLRSYMPHGIEVGFAAGFGEDSYYRYHDGNYDETTATRPGLAFSNLIHRLGGPAGRIEGPLVGRFPEYMPDGIPAPYIVASGNAPGTATNPTSGGDPKQTAAGYQFQSSFYSSFVQLQRGLGQGASHSNSGWFYAKDIGFLTKAD